MGETRLLFATLLLCKTLLHCATLLFCEKVLDFATLLLCATSLRCLTRLSLLEFATLLLFATSLHCAMLLYYAKRVPPLLLFGPSMRVENIRLFGVAYSLHDGGPEEGRLGVLALPDSDRSTSSASCLCWWRADLRCW
mmetsp:Transcript_12149/g.29471  ORF Transcript_12149/g.29471 Transcript_12149/m.29471 type:complete len:138 (+) Transcript_12149:99-512(+)